MIRGGPHAAGRHTTELAHAYRECKRIAAEHGRTYFLATRLLSAERRPAVHALYAFARMVDDIVDHAETDVAQRYPGDVREPELPEHGPAGELDLIEKQLRIALEAGVPDHGAAGPLDLPRSTAQNDTAGPQEIWQSSAPTTKDRRPRSTILLAVADTIHRYDIGAQHFWTFLDSMRMDVPGTAHFRDRYATMTDLHEYMTGSAAAIGLQVLPVLGTVCPIAEAEPPAAALGEAFQLTNFLRDVAEDLDRGRVYLPADELAAFGVDHELLVHCRHTRRTDPRVRRALAHLIAVNRDIYRNAEPGIDLLEPRVRPAIRTAAVLYANILDRIEAADYAIFSHRAVVPRHHRLRVAARHFAAATRRGRVNHQSHMVAGLDRSATI
ncbi:phytoene/squalene synthase family protein [Nocardia sp. CS682]|uniref:phytoene/squalene synthase family protein n=1 Tax=Nocardia sp. CS682 TaxID=1047172 RepID=UPI00107520B0|nr:phytoene/squalene synthase family protein [Nocardia sp. CS682]QBS44052.1 phytoene synthase [Nocardia sp. CS682]